MHEHVDQLATLARSDLFVTHAGMGGVMEALWFAVPMVCLPRTGEQQLVAGRVQDLGLGRVLARRDPTVEDLAEAFGEVRRDEAMPERLRAASGVVRCAGGRRAAADAVDAALATARAGAGG